MSERPRATDNQRNRKRMAGQQRDIEWIVGEVMRRLMDAERAVEETITETKMAKPPAKKRQEPKPGQLQLNHRVVTTAQIDGRLDGIRQVVVPVRAVVTPAVRDTLRKKRIALVSQPQPDHSDAESSRYTLGVVDPTGEFVSAIATVRAELGDVRQLDHDGLIQAVGGVVEQIETDRGAGLVLTRQPSVALCLANRRPGVRAAWAISVAAVRDAEQMIGANLLIVNPASHGIYELKGMIREFASGSHVCPESYRRLLDG